MNKGLIAKKPTQLPTQIHIYKKGSSKPFIKFRVKKGKKERGKLDKFLKNNYAEIDGSVAKVVLSERQIKNSKVDITPLLKFKQLLGKLPGKKLLEVRKAFKQLLVNNDLVPEKPKRTEKLKQKAQGIKKEQKQKIQDFKNLFWNTLHWDIMAARRDNTLKEKICSEADVIKNDFIRLAKGIPNKEAHQGFKLTATNAEFHLGKEKEITKMLYQLKKDWPKNSSKYIKELEKKQKEGKLAPNTKKLVNFIKEHCSNFLLKADIDLSKKGEAKKLGLYIQAHPKYLVEKLTNIKEIITGYISENYQKQEDKILRKLKRMSPKVDFKNPDSLLNGINKLYKKDSKNYALKKLKIQAEVWKEMQKIDKFKGFPFKEVWKFVMDKQFHDKGAYWFENEPGYMVNALKAFKFGLKTRNKPKNREWFQKINKLAASKTIKFMGALEVPFDQYARNAGELADNLSKKGKAKMSRAYAAPEMRETKEKKALSEVIEEKKKLEYINDGSLRNKSYYVGIPSRFRARNPRDKKNQESIYLGLKDCLVAKHKKDWGKLVENYRGMKYEKSLNGKQSINEYKREGELLYKSFEFLLDLKSEKECQKRMDAIFEAYDEKIEIAYSKEGRLMAHLWLVHELETHHFFADGNCRSSIIALYACIAGDPELPMPIYQDPNDLDYNSPVGLLRLTEEGIEEFNNLCTEKPKVKPLDKLQIETIEVLSDGEWEYLHSELYEILRLD